MWLFRFAFDTSELLARFNELTPRIRTTVKLSNQLNGMLQKQTTVGYLVNSVRQTSDDAKQPANWSKLACVSLLASLHPPFSCVLTLHDSRCIYLKTRPGVKLPRHVTLSYRKRYCSSQLVLFVVLFILTSNNLKGIWDHGTDGYPAVTARCGGVLPPWSRCHLPPVCRGHLQPLGCFQVRLLSFPYMIRWHYLSL